jgi:hypothetical protein
MMQVSDAHVTSWVLWRAVLVAAPIDIVFVALLASWMGAATLRRLKWLIAGTTAVFFAAVWAILACYLFWEPVYHYFFPAWSRWWLPLVYGIGFGVAGLLSRFLALLSRGNCVVNFCVLMGLWGMAGHVWAVHRGLLAQPPLLRGTSPVAAVVFSGFEFAFYAGLILTTAALLAQARERLQSHARDRASGASS